MSYIDKSQNMETFSTFTKDRTGHFIMGGDLRILVL